VTLDLVLFLGFFNRRRAAYKVRIVGKPINWGAKVYVLGCSESSYYFHQVPMSWTGRDARTPEFWAAHPGSESIVSLVEYMTRFLKRSAHLLVTDNWFTSVNLSKFCSAHNMAFIGAVKHFRGAKAGLLWPVSVPDCVLRPLMFCCLASWGPFLRCAEEGYREKQHSNGKCPHAKKLPLPRPVHSAVG